MTVEKIYKDLLAALQKNYSINESICIADMVIENIFGFSKYDRVLNKHKIVDKSYLHKFHQIIVALATHKPIQYVLEEAWFCNQQFFVNEHVLIPRAETEELIALMETFKPTNESVLDIGTGSGCISIILKNKFPQLNITAIDISAEALMVAQRNAQNFEAKVNFVQADFLDENCWKNYEQYDFIVSNPPYVKQSESSTMQPNVILFEPHKALFVPDNDALIFYKKIALFGRNHLKKKGKILVEINEAMGIETKQLFEQFLYHSSIIKDMQGKDRFIVCDENFML
ncbi:MAG: peptide chain release factor N(5)-glutamine methyltransferase [Chitinophagaceae bacterium]|nr:peptide chain release factor N(5)-glutamine methyltransferase [Chitinophagaceae bacterium]MCW5905839.1 peptide chain release factor N(5)-glutamine methyltransferase [Chitinophagaceae bacterium]